MSNQSSKLKLPTPLIWVFIIFIAPVTIAYIIVNATNYQQFNTYQYGTWQIPAITFIPVKPTTTNLQPMQNLQLTNKWTLLLNSENPTKEQIDNFNKLHRAFGRDMQRVQIALTNELHFTNKILIIDPNGQLIMHYPVQIDLRNVFKDVSKLLKNSSV